MERLLRYSLEHERPIRLIWQEPDGTMKQGNVQVLQYNHQAVKFLCLRPKGEHVCPMECILGADYKKGEV